MRLSVFLALTATFGGLRGPIADARTSRWLETVEETRCSDAADIQFLENIKEASNGCVSDASYDWLGFANPTDTERDELCKCDVDPFVVPDCTWVKKLGKYVATVAQHVTFVLDCPGKSLPSLTIKPVSEFVANATSTQKPGTTTNKSTKTPASSSTVIGVSSTLSTDSTSASSASFPLSTVVEPPAPRCNDQQTLTFEQNLKAASNG